MFLFLLSGCASYEPKALNHLGYEGEATVCTLKSMTDTYGDHIKLYAAILSSSKVRSCFNRDIGSKGYKIVQFTIVNNSDKSFVLSNSNIGASIANPDQVAKLVHTSTAGRATGYTLGSLILWPLIIPAVVDGVKSSEANDQLDTDFSERCPEVCYIPAHATRNHVIFMPKHSFLNTFELVLLGKEEPDLKLIYNVTL